MIPVASNSNGSQNRPDPHSRQKPRRGSLVHVGSAFVLCKRWQASPSLFVMVIFTLRAFEWGPKLPCKRWHMLQWHCWYSVKRWAWILSHALYMKAIHGGKAKNDRIDSFKIANLIRGGNFPLAYVYPKAMRATRDLLRRRMKIVRHGADLKAHVTNTTRPNKVNLKNIGAREQLKSNFPNPAVQKNINLDMAILDCYAEQLSKVEWYIGQQAKQQTRYTFTS